MRRKQQKAGCARGEKVITAPGLVLLQCATYAELDKGHLACERSTSHDTLVFLISVAS